MIFFQLVDNISEAISSRLFQKNVEFYVDAEELILSSANGQIKSLEDRDLFLKRIAAVTHGCIADVGSR